jgi:ribosomal protein L7/L12
MRQEQLEPRPSLPPHCCEVCGRDFGNEYFHTGGGGELVSFADFDDSAAKAVPPAAPGVVGVAWVCAEHVPAARERSALTSDAAVHDMQRVLGVRAAAPRERKANPELFVLDVGPNRAKVFGVVRQATGCTPDVARKLLERAPFKVAEGWPMQFDAWRRALEDAGAVVEIRWD